MAGKANKRTVLDPEIFEEILELDKLIQEAEDYDELFEGAVFRRDILIAEYPATAAFRDLQVSDLMRTKT